MKHVRYLIQDLLDESMGFIRPVKLIFVPILCTLQEPADELYSNRLKKYIHNIVKALKDRPRPGKPTIL
jgi:hypothetical protein